MTTPEFASLYYTDCLPGQGLRGGAGFQFQAVSSGAGQEAMTLVQRAVLYEPPVPWMRQQRPVTDYPPSLAHVYDDVYVTARGIYLGVEANGVREGNQFTHAVATADPEAYGQLRPAQLWAAPWWVEKPAPSTRCDPVAAEPEAGPWGIDAVREWVLGRPDAGEWLTAVHSAIDRLRDPDRRRVLFVAEDPAAVLGWIAAGTLLLPQQRALQVSFRVFVANPRYSSHDVLAVHPDWAGPLADTGRDGEFLVFNLVTGQHTLVEPTDSALHWVPRFLRAGPDDVYDVVDAIELAQQFAMSRQAGPDIRPAVADRLASGVVLLGDRPEDLAGPDVLAEWLAAQPSVATEDVAEPLVAALLDCRMDIDGRRALDRAVHRHGVRALVGRVRLALLTGEIEQALDGRYVVAGRAPHRWTPAERLEAAGMVEVAAEQVAPDRMNALLCLAVDFDVAPDPARFAGGAARFVRWWADHPSAAVRPDRWSCGPHLAGLLRLELAARCGPSVPDRLSNDIRAHWWPVLLPHVADPATEPDATVVAAAMAGGDAATRQRFGARTLEVLGAGEPDRVWSALFRFTEPNLTELMAVLRHFPPGTGTQSFVDNVFRVLDGAMAGTFAEAELEVLRDFAAHGQLPGKGRLRDIAEQDERLRAWLLDVAAQQPPSRMVLRTISGGVLTARTSAVLIALIDQMPLADAYEVVAAGSQALVGLLATGLPDVWDDDRNPTERRLCAIALGFLTAGTKICAQTVAVRIEEQLASWVVGADRAEVARVERLVGEVRERFNKDWHDFAAVQRDRAARSGRTRLAGKDRPRQGEPADAEPGKAGRLGFRLPGRRNREG
ncbi:MAG TPA: GTPase-associated protein 1-related protein [Pseudonocardiaceae bacterium]|nr:GTPase-associated protein 1-related protein [Pseudonocardiaceae bacterium]